MMEFEFLTVDVEIELTRLIPQLPGLSDAKWSEVEPFVVVGFVCKVSFLPKHLCDDETCQTPLLKHALHLELKLHKRKLNV